MSRQFNNKENDPSYKEPQNKPFKKRKFVTYNLPITDNVIQNEFAKFKRESFKPNAYQLFKYPKSVKKPFQLQRNPELVKSEYEKKLKEIERDEQFKELLLSSEKILPQDLYKRTEKPAPPVSELDLELIPIFSDEEEEILCLQPEDYFSDGGKWERMYEHLYSQPEDFEEYESLFDKL